MRPGFGVRLVKSCSRCGVSNSAGHGRDQGYVDTCQTPDWSGVAINARQAASAGCLPRIRSRQRRVAIEGASWTGTDALAAMFWMNLSSRQVICFNLAARRGPAAPLMHGRGCGWGLQTEAVAGSSPPAKMDFE